MKSTKGKDIQSLKLSKIELKLSPKRIDNKIIIDGEDVGRLVSKVNYCFDAVDATPTVDLELRLIDCEITGEGIVYFNGYPATNKIARTIYEQLREHFKNNEIDQED